MLNHSIIFLISWILCLISCKDHSNSEFSYEQQKDIVNDSVEVAVLFKTRCGSCHQPSGNHDSRLAPPVNAIQNHYLKKYPRENEFVEAIMVFATKPTNDKVLLKGAHNRFGLMPQQSFDTLELRQIGHYLYNLSLPPQGNHKGEKKRKQQRQKKG